MLEDSDHRKLAQRLDLLHLQEEAPGMVFWHPRGLVLYRYFETAPCAQPGSTRGIAWPCSPAIPT